MRGRMTGRVRPRRGRTPEPGRRGSNRRFPTPEGGPKATEAHPNASDVTPYEHGSQKRPPGHEQWVSSPGPNRTERSGSPPEQDGGERPRESESGERGSCGTETAVLLTKPTVEISDSSEEAQECRDLDEDSRSWFTAPGLDTEIHEANTDPQESTEPTDKLRPSEPSFRHCSIEVSA